MRARNIMIPILLFVFALNVFAVQGTYAAEEKGVEKGSSISKDLNAVVNINTASAEELQKIKGIGPAFAARIIQYRKENGQFQRIEDIVKVRGIGQSKFEKIKQCLAV
jgi:competence protein ComEA